MSLAKRIFQFPWRSRAQIARDVDAELGFHLDMRVGALTAQGVPPDEARRRARDEFGDIEHTRAYCRAVDERATRTMRAAERLAVWRQDVRYALRTLRRSPGFTAVSLLTLALAIGANTAIFSVTRAVLLAPLPYGDPDALVAVTENSSHDPTLGIQLSPPNYVDYRAQQRTFTGLAAYLGLSLTWRPASGDPQIVSAAAIARTLLDVLRVRPVRGRGFLPGEDHAGNDREVIATYDFWQRTLGGDAAAVGRHFTIEGQTYELIGVMPRGFTLGMDEQLLVPLGLDDDLAAPQRTRKQHYLRVIGRLKPGVTLAAARADLAAIGHRLAAAYPDADADRFGSARPLHDAMVGDLRPAIVLLQGAAALVLLIACANLANLTLSRAMNRRRELALRAALGAGRGRLVAQLLTESVLLALVGGAAGIVLAIAGARMLLALNPDALPAMFTVAPTGGVLWFSLALSVATVALFGLLPALGAVRADLNRSLKDGGRGATGRRGGDGVRRGLVVAQVSLAVMLLVGAGLLIRSFRELTRVRFGFDPDRVLTAQVRASGERYDSSAAVNRFYDGVLDDIARSPGVAAVGAVAYVPTQGRVSSTLRIEGEPADEAHLPDIGYNAVRGDFFKAMRIPLLAGREYDASDRADGPKTVIINQAAAARFFPRGDAVGHRIRIGPNPNGEWMTIIGVVGDIRDEGLDVPTKPTLFANHVQESWEHSMSIVIRTSGDPLGAAPALRRAVRSMDPTLAIRDINPLGAVVGSSLAARRFALGLASAFAAVALLLAVVGIYSVLAYAVAMRTQEFGVRLALGATARSVLVLVLTQGLAWSMLGLALGTGAALAARRLLAGMLFGVTALDPVTYVGVGLGLIVVVGLACLVPAARATRVDPLTSIRAE